MARCLYTFVQLGAGVGPGNVEGATLPQSEAPRCTVERFRTTMKTSISIVLGCSLVAFAAGPFVTDKTEPGAAGMNPARLARIPARIREVVIAGKTAGVVTLVARHGHVASLEAVGYQDLESKTPMRTDTIFRLASVTKPVTCAGIMILVDEGRLSLIDPAEKYLPEFKDLKLNPCGTRAGYNCALITPSRPVNILDLMTHTSGLPGGVPGREAPPNTLAENVAGVSRATLLFEPGTAWNYSNIGIAALGRIIEVSQQSSNVLFGQSRNVLLTGSSLEGGRRTTADDPGRARPAGGLEEGQEETDHAEAGCRGDRHHRAAGAATPAEAAAERRPGGNP